MSESESERKKNDHSANLIDARNSGTLNMNCSSFLIRIAMQRVVDVFLCFQSDVRMSQIEFISEQWEGEE